MKNNNLVAGAVLVVLGAAVGYFAGTTTSTKQVQPAMSGMHDAMGGMTSGLAGKVGDDLDKAFLDEMIVHHEGAVDMAHTLLAGTKRPELIKLGNDIIAAQTKEIEMMKGWRATWFK